MKNRKKAKVDLDFETYCKVKHDGDEYQALRALARVIIEDDLTVAGLSEEGLAAVARSLTQSQLDTFWDLAKIVLQENPEKLAEFQAFCAQRESESRNGSYAYDRNNGNGNGKGNVVGYVITLIACVALAVYFIVGIVGGWFSPMYIVHVIADSVVTVVVSKKLSGAIRNMR